MVLERVAKGTAATAGAGAGGFAGGLFSSPGFLILGALGILLLFFSGDIRKALGSFGENFGKVELPDITFPTFEFPDITFPTFEFPDITFPTIEFPDVFGAVEEGVSGAGAGALDFFSGLQQQFNDFIAGITGGAAAVPPPSQFEGAGTPEDPFIVPSGPPTGGTGIEAELDVVFTPAPPTPGPELPPGFVGGGPSFEGGTIFEISICSKSIGQIAQENGISASAAADLKAQACEMFDFDFGTNTGGGIGPGDPFIPGTSTTESSLEQEAIKAACTSCELFNLNCDQCLAGGGFA